jgi:hypothetical protein
MNHKEKVAESQRLARKRLQEFLKQNPHMRRSRGDVDPMTGLIFFVYGSRGKEIWLTKEEFEFRKNKSIMLRKSHREKRKLENTNIDAMRI